MKLYVAFILLCFLGGYALKLKGPWRYVLILLAGTILSLVYFYLGRTG